MPRYETENKFWALDLAGAKYSQKWGKTGGSVSMTSTNLKDLAKATRPNLEKLEIWCGDPNWGASGGVKELAPIFRATGLPKLTYFGLMNGWQAGAPES